MPTLQGLKAVTNTVLSDEDELKFQSWITDPSNNAGKWFSEYISKYGEYLDLDTYDYDYRKAYINKIEPEISTLDNTYHWASVTQNGEYLKSEGHPTMWKQHFVETFKTNPDDLIMQGISEEKLKALLNRVKGLTKELNQ